MACVTRWRVRMRDRKEPNRTALFTSSCRFISSSLISSPSPPVPARRDEGGERWTEMAKDCFHVTSSRSHLVPLGRVLTTPYGRVRFPPGGDETREERTRRGNEGWRNRPAVNGELASSLRSFFISLPALGGGLRPTTGWRSERPTDEKAGRWRADDRRQERKVTRVEAEPHE